MAGLVAKQFRPMQFMFTGSFRLVLTGSKRPLHSIPLNQAIAGKQKLSSSIFGALCLRFCVTSQCNFRIREFIHVRPPWRFNNWADCRSDREAHRSRQGAGRLSGDECDRRCWFFCCLLPRNTPGLDFRQSRQLAAGWLHPITDRGRYPAACLPLDTPAIRALNATSLRTAILR